MRRSLGPVVALALLLAGCTAPWQHPAATSATATATAMTTPASASVSAQSSPTTSVTSPVPAATPATVRRPSTPPPVSSPAATPRPAPRATLLTHSSCCGVFAWADATHLLAFDAPSGGPAGSYLFNLAGGAGQRVTSKFGPPSPSGIVPISDPQAGVTRLVRLDGTSVGQIQNGGVATWVSDNGRRVAWLQPIPGSHSPSSLVDRPANLWVANIDGSGARQVLSLLTAELSWRPDNRHVLLAGRNLDFSSPGIWLVDLDTGARQVLVSATYVRGLQLSPDGAWCSYLVTFSGNAAQDGLWVAEVNGPTRRHLAGSAMVRWGPNDETLWRLELGPGSSNDQLMSLNVVTGSQGPPNDLGGRVLNDDWLVAPDGRSVAYWRESDRNVVLVTPLR